MGLGKVSGPQINGEVPDNGLWFSTRLDGQRDIEAQIIIHTDDGKLIYMSYQGLKNNTGSRVFARFETGAEEYDWLNQTVAIGIFSSMPEFHLRFYTIK
jgi:hypothetical protein